MINKDFVLIKINDKKKELNELLPVYTKKAEYKKENLEDYKTVEKIFNQKINELLDLYREFYES